MVEKGVVFMGHIFMGRLIYIQVYAIVSAKYR
jgi:hypothetical protein